MVIRARLLNTPCRRQVYGLVIDNGNLGPSPRPAPPALSRIQLLLGVCVGVIGCGDPDVVSDGSSSTAGTSTGQSTSDAGPEATRGDSTTTSDTGVTTDGSGNESTGTGVANGSTETTDTPSDTTAGETGCDANTGECGGVPSTPVLELNLSPVKRFDFSWSAAAGGDFYRLQESPGPGQPFAQLGDDIVGNAVSHEVPLHLRWEASYRLLACNAEGCAESAAVDVVGSLVDAIGYAKASDPDSWDRFGWRVALSADGQTLAVSAIWEESSATGIGGDPSDNSAERSGAVYVFVREEAGSWAQQAYVKASNADADDRFGSDVALSADGDTLAVSAVLEDSGAMGIDGDQSDNSAEASGATYVFVRSESGTWTQQSYLKASNTDADDRFGTGLALSGDGSTLAVATEAEASASTGINGNGADNSTEDAGAVYVFVRDMAGDWAQQAYVKASNTNAFDNFGESVALSEDGDTLAVGADWENSASTGIDGSQSSNTAINAGAAYIFVRDDDGTWLQQSYLKASNASSNDNFGQSVALSSDGNVLAVGADGEDSSATGVGGDQTDNAAPAAGAAYLFARDESGAWSQEAYVKASNPEFFDRFGGSVALSADGGVLAVSAPYEDGGGVGVQSDQADNTANDSGAVYIFVRPSDGAWSQQTYSKASNTSGSDEFGITLTMSGSGETLVVGARLEDGGASGLNGDQADDSNPGSGAVYFY